MVSSSKPALTREHIHEVLWKLTATHLGKEVSEVNAKSRLVQDLGADSLDVAELTMSLEEELGITLPNEGFDNPNLTLGEIEEAVCKQCL
jgi:acyl carrier protein